MSGLIALGGVLVGIFGRDVLMALFLARRRRQEEVQDKAASDARAHRELVRLYADPLREAAASLRFRLDEIIAYAAASYLLAGTPKTIFVEYKQISTVYRLAVLLGWIRAFRRERSYLDPEETSPIPQGSDPIGAIERALADGQHIEEQRLSELCGLWRVRKDPDNASWSKLAAALDAMLHAFLSEKSCLSAADLQEDQKVELAHRCARLVGDQTKTDIPNDLVQASAAQASVFLGIKEAYIYRDWQAGLGDLMLRETPGAPRRFDVMGFREFEVLYNDFGGAERRWIERLEALFHDLDMGSTGIFDARREQLKNLHRSCKALEEYLTNKATALTLR
jgi:hypothetical protein